MAGDVRPKFHGLLSHLFSVKKCLWNSLWISSCVLIRFKVFEWRHDTCKPFANTIQTNLIKFQFFLELDPCDSFPCQNGGACESQGAEYFCICLGFRGDNCEIPINSDDPPAARSPTTRPRILSSPGNILTTINDATIGPKEDSVDEKTENIALFLAIGGAAIVTITGKLQWLFMWTKQEVNTLLYFLGSVLNSVFTLYSYFEIVKHLKQSFKPSYIFNLNSIL